MSNRRRTDGAKTLGGTMFKGMRLVLVSMIAVGALIFATSASAEEQAANAPLPFDPLAIELLLPSSNVDNDFWSQSWDSSRALPIKDLTYSWAGKTKTVSQYLGESGTDSFLVLDDGKVAYEKYYDLNNVYSRHQSWSMMKSVVSAMIGIAISEGKIASVNDPVTKYVPALKANGYNGVSIRDVLHMASGVKFSEAYLDFTTGDVNYLFVNPILDNLTGGLLGQSLNEFAADPKFVREREPGTAFDYSSLDSEVLGMVLRGATGVSPSTYLEQKIWRRAGMISDATVAKDREGTDYTFCCLYSTARDYGRFGEIYRNNGRFKSRQIVPASWVYDSTHSSEAWLHNGILGYGYQWWLDEAVPEAFFANGFEGQHIYVSPTQKATIVKLSDDLGMSGPSRMPETLKVFQTIAAYTATH